MWLKHIDSAIRYSFYFLAAVVPLLMWRSTSELFELNKMWAVWGMSLFILFLWIAKILLTKKFLFQRTPLDIPIALFFLSQLISTLFSMDPYVSFWGYYSRFNGGFLSLLSYIFLYYAFATHVLNDNRRHTIQVIAAAFIGGIIVALWGFPSHFGYDPTCLMFRGTLDVSCWTEAFQPKLRIFSTLGQPNWLAAYLAILIPVSLAFGMHNISKFLHDRIDEKNALFKGLACFAVALLFYVDLTWTDSQSGFIGLWVGLFIFTAITVLTLLRKKIEKKIHKKNLSVLFGILAIFLLTSVILGTPVERLRQFSLATFTPEQTAPKTETTPQEGPTLPALEYGGTDSSKIRLIVWKGALDIFKTNPIFGSGVETFAYAYYKHRPAEHNLTSEWDYLYNKAHNEYLNYLATTGLFGLGTYLLFIGWVIFLFMKCIRYHVLHSKHSSDEPINQTPHFILSVSLFAGWISILVSNFFGFSVVLTNLFLFLLPLWILHLAYPKFHVSESAHPDRMYHSTGRKIVLGLLILISLLLIRVLFRYWEADKDYGLGSNLNKVGDYVTANPYLISAVQQRPREDIFKDELAVNVSTLALLYQQQNEATQAAQLAQQAKFLSDSVISRHPNNVVFWKSRTRIMYSLAQIDPSLYSYAIEAIDTASKLAPTDAKVLYNKALLYDQGGQREQALKLLTQTIKLKPNYRDALYAKALIHSEIAESITATNSAQAQQERSQAIEDLQLILNHIVPNDTQAKELLEKLQ